jgi:hypothetical protein
MINTVRRLIDAYDLMFEVLLLKHFEANDLDEDMIPTAPIRRIMMIEDIFKKEPEVLKNTKLYRLYKLLLRTPQDKYVEAYRRHVAVHYTINGEEFVLNIDRVTENYLQIKKFWKYVYEHITEEELEHPHHNGY